MSHHYQYADVRLAADFAIPELAAWTRDDAPASTMTITLRPSTDIAAAPVGEWTSTWRDPQGHTVLLAARHGDDWWLRFPCVLDVHATADGQVTLYPDAEASIESIRHLLLDQALPRLLARGHCLVMHGALVCTSAGHALLLLGDSGFGKSTLASAFATQGGRLLSDDCAVLDTTGDGVLARATYPALRLWPDSLAHLPAAHAATSTAMAHYSDKRRLAPIADSDAATAVDAATRIDAIVVLQKALQHDIVIETIHPQVACMALVRNAFQLDLRNHDHYERQLARAAAISRRTPVLALGYPRDYALLPDVVARLSAYRWGNEHLPGNGNGNDASPGTSVASGT